MIHICILTFYYFYYKTPVSFNDNLLPVCFPTSASSPAVNKGMITWATGWGSLYSGGTATNNLMQVDIPVLSDNDCRGKYEEANLTSSFCAGETGGNKDACQGDSGGPLVTQDSNGKWNVVGITSFGYGCSDGGVYTRVIYFYHFILSF
jgi:trypsin